MHKKIGEVRLRGSQVMHPDRQIDAQTDRQITKIREVKFATLMGEVEMLEADKLQATAKYVQS